MYVLGGTKAKHQVLLTADLGFCLDHTISLQAMSFFFIEQGESLFFLINTSILPALLGIGRMLLCSNSSEHRRARKISVIPSLTQGTNQFDLSRHLQLSTAPALPFRKCFGLHLARRMQSAETFQTALSRLDTETCLAAIIN